MDNHANLKCDRQVICSYFTERVHASREILVYCTYLLYLANHFSISFRSRCLDISQAIGGGGSYHFSHIDVALPSLCDLSTTKVLSPVPWSLTNLDVHCLSQCFFVVNQVVAGRIACVICLVEIFEEFSCMTVYSSGQF